MSLSILHELDHPTSPLGEGAAAAVLEGAQTGHQAAQRYTGSGYFDILKTQLGYGPRPILSREFFVGQAIGIRAGLIDHGVELVEDEGFLFSGSEIAVVRDAKTLGINKAPDYMRQGLGSFNHRLLLLLQDAREEGAISEPADGVGVVIGQRYVDLSERVAA